MLNIVQFRELIVKSTLNDIMMYSKNAEEMMVFTCAAESEGGTFLRDIDSEGLGIYHMQPQVYNDIWQNYIKYNGKLFMMLSTNLNIKFMLIYDLRFATAVTRLFYARITTPLPFTNDVDAMWDYYKQYYNTSLDESEKDNAIKNYYNFISH